MKRDMYAYGEWWVPIYATQVNETEIQQQATWCGGKPLTVVINPDIIDYKVEVETPYGVDKATVGDWIIEVQNLFYVLTDAEFHRSFIKWDARAGGNTDLQEWPRAPRQLMTKRREKEDHGHVIRNPKAGRR